MTRFGWILILGLLAGCGDDGDAKTGCTEACRDETPHCDAARDRCVVCLEDGDCEGDEVCVATVSGAACGECRTEADCGGGHCLEGRCIECTVASEAADCGVYSCDPQMNVCTGTQRGSLLPLAPCRADSECQGDDTACVPTFFKGDDDGAHCLRATPNCTRPLMTVTNERTSLSWASPRTYCGFNEDFVSAQAIRSMHAGTECSSDDDVLTCGAGGLCRLLNSSPSHRCTIPCEVDEECYSGGGAAGCNTIAGHCGDPQPP